MQKGLAPHSCVVAENPEGYFSCKSLPWGVQGLNSMQSSLAVKITGKSVYQGKTKVWQKPRQNLKKTKQKISFPLTNLSFWYREGGKIWLGEDWNCAGCVALGREQKRQLKGLICWVSLPRHPQMLSFLCQVPSPYDINLRECCTVPSWLSPHFAEHTTCRGVSCLGLGYRGPSG